MATKLLDINTASQEELAEFPMIGEERAQTLVASGLSTTGARSMTCPALVRRSWMRSSRKAAIWAGRSRKRESISTKISVKRRCLVNLEPACSRRRVSRHR